jgi:hypothetical protein
MVKIGAGVIDAEQMTAGHRMTADESSAASQIMKIGTNRAFDAADIGKHRAWMQGGHQAYGWRDRADGHRRWAPPSHSSLLGGGSHVEDPMGSIQSSLTLGGVSGTSPPRLKVRGKGAIRLPAPKGEAKIARPNSQGEANSVMRNGLKMPLLDRAVLSVDGPDDRDDGHFPEMKHSQSAYGL